jgi:hypothetical protein
MNGNCVTESNVPSVCDVVEKLTNFTQKHTF